MIDFYYEFPEGTKLFNEPVRFAYIRGFHPEEAESSHKFMHNQAYINASRVWLENANAVYLIKPAWAIYRGHVDLQEFTMVKLKSKNLHRAYDNAW